MTRASRQRGTIKNQTHPEKRGTYRKDSTMGSSSRKKDDKEKEDTTAKKAHHGLQCSYFQFVGMYPRDKWGRCMYVVGFDWIFGCTVVCLLLFCGGVFALFFNVKTGLLFSPERIRGSLSLLSAAATCTSTVLDAETSQKTKRICTEARWVIDAERVL